LSRAPARRDPVETGKPRVGSVQKRHLRSTEILDATDTKKRLDRSPVIHGGVRLTDMIKVGFEVEDRRWSITPLSTSFMSSGMYTRAGGTPPRSPTLRKTTVSMIAMSTS
jgi:hypothetical protein